MSRPRVLSKSIATASFALLMLSAVVVGQVRITEVMANPNAAQGGQTRGEFVELYNLGAEPVDLTGWKIADRDNTDQLLAFDGVSPLVLAPKSYAVVLDPDHEFNDENVYAIPPETLLLRPHNSALGNGLALLDPVYLLDPTDEVVDTFTPPSAAHNGNSTERIDYAGPDAPENWQFCTEKSGTTIGRKTSPPKPPIQPPTQPPTQPPGQPPVNNPDLLVALNEVMFRPETDAPEWVELFNRTNVDLPITGWTLQDARGVPVAIPESSLPKKGYAILTRNAADFHEFHPNTPGETAVIEMPLPALNDDGDELVLKAGDRELDRMRYGDRNAERGQSLERRDPALDSLSMGNWFLSVHLDGSTPGAENSVRHQTGAQPLIEASPNPFVPQERPIELRFEAPIDATVTLRIFDSKGMLAHVLLDNAPNGGRQTLKWDGKNDAGEQVAPGIYIVQLLTVAEDNPRATAIAIVVAER
ncbi:MAG: lamin tail domain-containing protein [Candidatus Poribacteria bacterium]|nr:lamin tail domain-containing protein [Candidatus Poribacteria bacterium]